MQTMELGHADLIPLMSMMTGDEKHAVAASSTLDVIWTLYDKVLSVDPRQLDDPNRDRFLLSKGHGPMAYYAVLVAKGFISLDDLATFGRFESKLGHHPDRTQIPGVEISSGSLGHGLPIAVGMAMGLDLDGSVAKVYCLLGDGELGEGSNHEAIVVASRFGLDRLTAIVVDNQSPYLGWPGGVASRFEVEGWMGLTVDGRDHEAIEEALTVDHPGRPLVVVADVGNEHD